MGRPGAAEIVRRSATARVSVAYIRRDNVSVETHTRGEFDPTEGLFRDQRNASPKWRPKMTPYIHVT
jgi:hypothetical protein